MRLPFLDPRSSLDIFPALTTQSNPALRNRAIRRAITISNSSLALDESTTESFHLALSKDEDALLPKAHNCVVAIRSLPAVREIHDFCCPFYRRHNVEDYR